jgi:hypothetical protein
VFWSNREPEPPKEASASSSTEKTPKKRRWPKVLGISGGVLVLLLIVARLLMPWGLRWYVNGAIARSPLYMGKIGDIDVHLWRGAYSINDIRLIKTTGNIPVPLFSAKRLDLAMEWKQIWHHKLVGQVVMIEPQLNFVAGKTESESQTGATGPWLEMLKDLFPFKLNSARVQDGSIHFRTYQTQQPVDVYMRDLNASIDNLTNINDDVNPLITTVRADAKAMGQADFEFRMKMDPFSYNPTFHLTTRLLGLDVTKINELSRAYGKFDFKRGYLDLIIELDAKEGQLTGYVKPLFRDLKVFDLVQDLKDDDPLQAFWQAVLGVVTFAFKNQPRDQFGTLIPFTGSVEGPGPDILATVGNVLRNAFIRAYLPKLQSGQPDMGGMQFDAPQITDVGAAGNSDEQ